MDRGLRPHGAATGRSPDGVYGISHTADGAISVVASPAETTEVLHGPVREVLDSLAGRGPVLTEVLGRSTPSVMKLSRLREVAT
ncbi:hypothetical protein ACWD04_32035 [Streptomyces sp. NPDC002911]